MTDYSAPNEDAGSPSLPPEGSQKLLEFDLTIEDHVNYGVTYQRSSLLVRWILLITVGTEINALVGALVSPETLVTQLGKGVPALVIFGGICWLLASKSGATWLLNRQVQKSAPLPYGSWKVTIQGTSFHVDWPHHKGDTDWSAVHNVSSNNSGIQIFVNQACAYLLPARAFESAATMGEFGDYIEQKWKGAVGSDRIKHVSKKTGFQTIGLVFGILIVLFYAVYALMQHQPI